MTMPQKESDARTFARRNVNLRGIPDNLIAVGQRPVIITHAGTNAIVVRIGIRRSKGIRVSVEFHTVLNFISR